MSAANVQRRLSSTSATLLGVGSIFIWCWTGVCYRYGAEFMGPMAYMALIAATGVATILLLRIVRKRPLAPVIWVPKRLAFVGFWGVAVYSILLVAAFGTAEERDFGQVNLLNYLWPIWMVVMGLVLLPEKRQVFPALLGVVLGFVGVVIAGGPDSLTHFPSNRWPHAMALVGGFLWALYSVLVRRWEKLEGRARASKGRMKEDTAKPNGVAFYFAVCALLAAALAAYQGEWATVDWTNRWTAFWVALGGIGPTGIAYYWWEIAITDGDDKYLTPVAYLIPVVSSILIGWFFREALNWGLLPGAALITAGALLPWWAAKRTQPMP